MQKIKAGIVGAGGYAGAELVRLLVAHPAIAELRIAARDAEGHFTDTYPALLQASHLVFARADSAKFRAGLDTVFLATPHGVSMGLVPEFLQAGIRVVDLSADFRLRDVKLWERTYQQQHACPEYLDQAVYALPELHAAQFEQAQLLACPGCYPTAVLLGLLPALEAGAIDPDSLVADCKSGISGAGRKPKTSSLFAESSENFSAYAVEGHRHQPEIEQLLTQVTGAPAGLVFTPHLAPMARGMLATLHFRLQQSMTLDDLHQLYSQRYRDEPFVHVETPPQTPQTRWVRGTNMCRIGLAQPLENRVVVVSAIDNLGKGAAGQAVEVFNLALGMPRQTGLELTPTVP